MKGKTTEEAKKELEAGGLSGEKLESILPHKVRIESQPLAYTDPYMTQITTTSQKQHHTTLNTHAACRMCTVCGFSVHKEYPYYKYIILYSV